MGQVIQFPGTERDTAAPVQVSTAFVMGQVLADNPDQVVVVGRKGRMVMVYSSSPEHDVARDLILNGCQCFSFEAADG